MCSAASNIDMFRVLGTSAPKYRKAIIKHADKKLVGSICEAVYNTLIGNIVLSNAEKDKLAKYKKPMRKLIQKSNLKSKKKILIQQGGFLQYLLPAVITGISSIISSAISSKNSD